MRKSKQLILGGLLITLVSCCQIPDTFKEVKDVLNIYPDYQDVYIPCNIAPLNFRINNEASSYLTKIYSKNGKPIIVKGKNVQLNIHDWKTLINKNKGEYLYFEVYMKQGKSWSKYPVMKNRISEDSIDNYVVYRLIQPLYMTYEDMSINQRNLENFEVKDIYDIRLNSTEKASKCVNCHSFQNYNRTGKMQLHLRGKNGGTVLVSGNQYKKVNPKAKGLTAGAVYPSWHPSLNYIAYSINTIGQDFHTKKADKVEVMDSNSDLILYNVEKNEVIKVTSTDDWFETFPYWSPDGNYLYYTTARFISKSKDIENEIISNYEKIKYNIVRMPFDKDKITFGKADTIFSASTIGKSAAFPRISPDGKYLLFSMGDCGNFHIWHKSSDLYLIDLNTRVFRNLEEINSLDVESYHSWSSNGRWIIFSSRREDGAYTRLYISYFDKNGLAHKPFILPQKDPLFNKRFFKSYNIPEFIVVPSNSNRHKIAKTVSKEAEIATLVQ